MIELLYTGLSALYNVSLVFGVVLLTTIMFVCLGRLKTTSTEWPHQETNMAVNGSIYSLLAMWVSSLAIGGLLVESPETALSFSQLVGMEIFTVFGSFLILICVRLQKHSNTGKPFIGSWLDACFVRLTLAGFISSGVMLGALTLGKLILPVSLHEILSADLLIEQLISFGLLLLSIFAVMMVVSDRWINYRLRRITP